MILFDRIRGNRRQMCPMTGARTQCITESTKEGERRANISHSELLHGPACCVYGIVDRGKKEERKAELDEKVPVW